MSASWSKRVFSSFCALVLVVSLMPLPAYAQTVGAQEGNAQLQAAQIPEHLLAGGEAAGEDAGAETDDSAEGEGATEAGEAGGGMSARSEMTAFAGGSGTAADPYLISTEAELKAIGTSGCYKLAGNIMVSSWPKAIGASSSTKFAGTFDGGGFTVTLPANAPMGLFGYTNGATIKDVTVEGSVSFSSVGAVGGLVAEANDTTITNCSNHASVTSSSHTTGGLVGYASGCTVTYCSNRGDVASTMSGGSSPRVGGLVGRSSTSSISDCYNAGSVTTLTGGNGGGLLGWLDITGVSGKTTNLQNCYSSGTVTSSKGGALIGGLYNPSDSYKAQNFVSDCYASDACGKSNLVGTYSTGTLEGTATVSNVAFKSDATMRTESFVTTMGDKFMRTTTYPQLSWEPGDGFPSITAQPVGTEYSKDGAATALTVGAELPVSGKLGWAGTLSYQWHLVNGEGTDTAVGTNAASYTPPTDVPGTYQYYCVVTNTWTSPTAGTAENKSDVATVTVVDGSVPAATVGITPGQASYTFTQDVAAPTVSATVSLTENAANVGTLTYQWQRKAADAEDAAFEDVADASGTLAASGGTATVSATLGTTGAYAYRLIVTNTFQGVAHEATADIPVTIDPVAVTTGAQWNTFAASFNGGAYDDFAALKVRITSDLTGVTTPLGTETHPFTGELFGYSTTGEAAYPHKVDVSITGAEHQALVGYARNAEIHDLIVTGSVQGTHHVAGAIAYATGTDYANDAVTRIYNVGNRATVTSTATDTGLSATWGTGGVAGTLNSACIVERCYNSGDITAPAQVGGVVGYANNTYYYVEADRYYYPNICELHELYNTGTVSASAAYTADIAYAGGILGRYVRGSNDGYAYSTVSNCYNAGKVLLTMPDADEARPYYGAIVGSGSGGQPGKYANNFYLKGLIYHNDVQLPDVGSQLKGDSGNTAVSLLALSDNAGAELLNALAGDAFYKQDANGQNDAFPLLAWEPAEAVPHCTYTFTVTPTAANVKVTDARGRVVAPTSSSTASGNLVVVYSLVAGAYTYSVEPDAPDDYLPEAGTIDISTMNADTTGAKVVNLVGDKHATTFNVTSGNAAVSGVTVTATHQATGRSYAATGAGAGLVLNLLPGTYDYTVAQPRNNTASGTVTVGSAAQSVSVDLVPCVKVTLVVQDSDGNSITDATITVKDGQGNAVALDEGSYYVPDSIPVTGEDGEGTPTTTTPPFTYQVDKVGYDRATGSAVVSGGKIDDQAEVTYTITLNDLSTWDGSTMEEPLADEDGTYLISNAKQLAWFANKVNTEPTAEEVLWTGVERYSNYDAKLVADIQLNGDELANQFTPIAAEANTYYTGTFDGDGHTISGLFLVGANNVGLFGNASGWTAPDDADDQGAIIKNVVVSGRVSGTNYVAGLLGYASGSVVIQDCGSFVAVRGVQYVGGILGAHAHLSSPAQVTGCFNKGNVTLATTDSNSGTEGYVGGIVGDAYWTDIAYCYNLGTITSNGYGAGGIAGFGWVNTVTLEHCYSTGNVVSKFNALHEYYENTFGGIMGYYASAITTQFGDGSYYLEGSAPLGVGYNSNYANYVNDQTKAITSATGLTANLNRAVERFADPANASFNGGYPRLDWESAEAAPPVEPVPVEDGSEEYPWIIGSYAKLIEFQNAVNSGRTYAGDFVKLTADIDCAAGYAAVPELGKFTGIGNGERAAGATSKPFMGTFDGDGHAITNIEAVESSPASPAGVFANLRAGTIRHLRVQGTLECSGDTFAGGLVGYAYNATVEDCHVQMNITQAQGDSEYNAASIAGVVGRAYQSTVRTCLYDGAINAPYAAFVSGITNTSSATDGTVAGNYYHNSGSSGVTGGLRGVDEGGAAEQVSSVTDPAIADELAWKLNTAGGTQANSSVWGNGTAEAGAPLDGVQFACAGATAVYRVTNNTAGITVTITKAYAHAGDTVQYEDLKAKKGYTLTGGAIVYKAADPEDIVYVDRTGSSYGSFPMPAADVVIWADTTFNADTVFNVSCGVVSADDVERTATVAAEPTSGKADTTTVTVTVSNVDENSRVAAVAVYENDVDRAPVAVKTVSIGAKYTFSMPRADAYVEVTLGDVRSSGDWWPSEELLDSAKHIYEAPYASDGNYLAGLLRVDGSDVSGLADTSYYGTGNRSTLLWALDELESSSIIIDKYHYRAPYSIVDGNGAKELAEYQGIAVYDYLVLYGMSTNLPDSVPVRFSNKAGDSVTLTMADLRSHEFGAFDAEGNKIADAVPVILAYGEGTAGDDSSMKPIPMDVAERGSDGSAITYAQSTPLTLVVGQRESTTENAGYVLKGVNQVQVGDSTGKFQPKNDRHTHVNANYTEYMDDPLGIEIIADGVKVAGVELNVEEVESFADSHPEENEDHYVWGSQWYADGVLLSSDDQTSTDIYEGVSIQGLLEYAVGIPDEDIDDAVLEIYSQQSYGDELTASYPLRYFLGGEVESEFYDYGTFEGNDTLCFYGVGETAVRPYIAFGKNGFPIVYDGQQAGYDDGSYNRFGPLIAVLPANEYEGYEVAGGGSYTPDAFLATYVSKLVVRYGSDAPKTDLSDAIITGIDASYTETGAEIRPVPTVTLPDGTVLVPVSDYSVTYSDNVKPGTATVTIEAAGGSAYTGKVVRQFTITAAQSPDDPTTPTDPTDPIDPVKPPKIEPAKWTRLWGDTALDTMQSISRYGWSSSDAVVISTVEGYWDALAASSVAGLVGAPVLLTSPDSLSTQVAAEIGRLGASTAYIVGGTAAVSSTVESQARSLLAGDARVVRLAGDDAQGTARAIAAELGSQAGDLCIIATSNGYWDALSASPFSYANRAPIFLTDAEGNLTADTLSAIRAGSFKGAVITGGTAAVSGSVEGLLKDAGVEDVTRLGGKDAYETSGLVASWALRQGMEADGMGIATSSGYWDALSGAALCGKMNSVLLLADDDRTDNAALASAYADDVRVGFVFGGTAAIGDGAEAAFEKATE